MEKLFLLDAYALIYRAYYALFRNPRVTSKGVNTSAIFGFVNTLEDLIKKEEPTHLAVCFDPPGGHTFRHDLFPDYKANREKQPEDITVAVPYIKQILKAMCIPVVELREYEADDVIGTLAHRASASSFTTYMMTPDKDYGQLVRNNIFMYRPALKGQGFEVRGPQQVCDRYGIDRPEQVIDLLALEGDASDNIPGCPGVGEKTAVKLICQFDSVENMLAHTDEIKGTLKAKIEENRDKILLSKDLATIRTDIPINIEPESLRRCEPDYDALRQIYEELEFRSFIAKLPNARRPAPEAQRPTPDDGMGSLFDLESEQPEEVNYAASKEDVLAKVTNRIGLSIYAIGAEAMTAEVQGFAIAATPELAAYFPTSELDTLKSLLSNPELEIVTNDYKRDLILLRRFGINWTARHYDISLAHYLLQPEMKHSLSDIAAELLHTRTLDAEQSVATKKYAALENAQNVICQRADLSLRLYTPLKDELRRNEISPALEQLEQDLAPVLADMEWNGVRIDAALLAQQSITLTKRMEDMEQQAYEMVGHPFNISSPSQVGHVLFAELQLDSKVKRTKTGGYSTTEETLEKYRDTHPIVDLILEIRGLRKLLATYINALPTLVNPRTGKIHTTFNQTGTATGRLSSVNPNLQNIPIRTDEGREIRRAFIADPGCLILSADYSQIELRLMADISGDTAMIEAFARGQDIHRATAAMIYHEALNDVTDTQRRNAKTANFGIIYGISAFGLSERLKIPRGEAKQLIDGYFASYPAVKQYMTDTVEHARQRGYVTTVMGRRRMLPDITSRNAIVRGYAERNAINAPLQGSAADIIKCAMVDIAARMKKAGLRSTMIIQVHDELVFNVLPDELPTLQEIVTSSMQGAYHGKVSLEVSAGTATNWLDAH
ncbi:MAG: DNA polymerase I [Bacteroides sp.]|nr:DNA polymerase I [Bacteroides sp.]MCM1378863.1 DNA polymerase I [Bacteroides sp.]MCM1445479.1 DNA polymerase I [Prevotella sp.]